MVIETSKAKHARLARQAKKEEGVKVMNIEHGKLVAYQVRDYRGLVRATLETEQEACKAALVMSRGGGSYPASVCRVEAIIELTRYFGGEEKPLF